MTDRMRVVLATRNAGKAREFGRLLAGAFEVVPLPSEVGIPEETGETFAENALLKAESAFVALGGFAAVLADDSGLEVDALGGRPGVQSARYAGEAAGDSDNVAKLLRELLGVTDRRARFVCTLCLLVPRRSSGAAPAKVEVRGESAGVIEHAPRGDRGFGYDPVFRPMDWSETLAEAGPERKDQVSHRGAAARSLVKLARETGLVPSREH